MRLGVSTASFYPDPVEDILPHLASMGIAMAEVFVNTDSECTPEFGALLAARAAQSSIKIVSVHPYTSLIEGMMLFSEYDRRTADGFALYHRYFALCQALGAHCLTFHGERDIGTPDYDPRKMERKLEVYRRLCEESRAYGVVIAQENVAWCRSRDPQYLRLLYENVPALRYTLDIKQAHRAGHDWREVIEAIGDRLVNVHINDFCAEHSCLLPGAGDMDYDDLFRRLAACGYDDQVLIEVYRSNFQEVDEMERALHFLSRWARL